jgi:hypothetical protein
MSEPAGPGEQPLCVHCEKAPQTTELRLCARCAHKSQVRVLYKPVAAAWSAHLDRLAARARLRLPLFPREEEGGQEPSPQA